MEPPPIENDGTQPVRQGWCWLALAVLLVIGVWLRFHNIERNGLWVDEMWAVFIACGRGVSAFYMPTNQLVPPIQLGLIDAPAWWYIWANIGTSIHPPLYHLTLRGWMTLFGDSDLATRSLSAVFGLVGIVVLFDIIRRTSGYMAAFLAAAVMTVAVSQIDFSQEARPYTMIVFLGLIACRAVVLIEKGGATKVRLAQLAIATTASFLTHYFTIFSFAGLGLYVLLRLRGSDRIKTAIAMFAGGIVAAVAWGPWFWRQYQSGDMGGMLGEIVRDPAYAFWHPLWRVAKLAADHLYGIAALPIDLAIAVLVFVVPLLLIRRSPERLMWWLWAVASMAGITITDMLHHTFIGSNMRYTFLATPAICALVSAPWPLIGWKRWLIPVTVLLSLVVATSARVQYGEPYPSWPLFARPDFRALAGLVNKTAGPEDALVFYPDAYIGTPIYFYATFNHYEPQSKRPVVILDGPANADLLKQLSACPHVFLVGVNPMSDGARMLPGWQSRDGAAISRVGAIAQMIRQ